MAIMYDWRVKFQIGGKEYEQVVTASSAENAKEIIKNIYRGQKIFFANTRKA